EARRLPETATARRTSYDERGHGVRDRAPRKTILVVDDDLQTLSVFRDCLADWGYRVLVAASASEARAVWRSVRGNVDLLIVDVKMPVEGGPDLILDLAGRLGARCPFLYISGHPTSLIPGYDEQTPFLEKP